MFCGIGHFWAFPGQYLALRPDVAFSAENPLNAIGQALPAAIGGAFAEPDRPAILVDGDASLLMNIQELETAARYGIDLVVLVMNDGALGAEMHKLNASARDGTLVAYRSPEFATIAAGMGGSGERLETVAELERAIATLGSKPRPVVLDVRVSPLVVSDPYQRLYFGRDNRAPRVPVLGVDDPAG